MRGRRAWFNFNMGVESSIDRGSGQSRILSLPTWAGISTLAFAPGCCGFNGPVPSATLDKRCLLKQRMQNSKIGNAVKWGIRLAAQDNEESDSRANEDPQTGPIPSLLVARGYSAL